MGLFRLVARVGCLRGGATRPLEEWPHIRLRFRALAEDRTRLTGPLAIFVPLRRQGPRILFSSRAGLLPSQEHLEPLSGPQWPSRNDRTTGASRAGALMATRA